MDDDLVHGLVIDRLAAHDLLDFTPSEQRAWLEHAARHGRCLLVVSSTDSLELYSTTRDSKTAFRPLFELLQARVARQPGAGKIKTRQLSGTAAAERLLERAAGVALTASGVKHAEALIRGAAALATTMDTLGPTLGSLCWTAVSVARRVQEEAEVGDEFEAQRIVEEELARWRAELAEVRRSVAPAPCSVPASTPFSEEPGSLIRIKVPKGRAGALGGL
jgi:hypothetical protein